MTPKAFAREYLGTFDLAPQQELYALAVEYESRCEAYDQRVCSARNERGVAMPANGGQMGLINRHAMKVRDEILPQVIALGFDWKQFKVVLSEVQRRYESARQITQ